jgi:hypothetical protein
MSSLDHVLLDLSQCRLLHDRKHALVCISDLPGKSKQLLWQCIQSVNPTLAVFLSSSSYMELVKVFGGSVYVDREEVVRALKSGLHGSTS